MSMRTDIIKLANCEVVGVELGVAQGVFSQQALQHQPIKEWYAIDMWAGDRGHNVNQYMQACEKLAPYPHAKIIKSRFEDVVDDFADEYFDFIYIDGYAHTGQEGGKTLTDWWPKLKCGGVFAGDDYHSDWPLTQKSVDEFAKTHDRELHIHHFGEHNHWSRYPSWYMIK